MTTRTITRSALFLAILASIAFFAFQSATPASAQQAPDNYCDTISHYDPDCHDDDSDRIPTPTCDDPESFPSYERWKEKCDPDPNCDDPTSFDSTLEYIDECYPDDDCPRTPATHAFPIDDDCDDDTPRWTCEDIERDMQEGVLAEHIMDWYEENCTRDEYTCRDLAKAIAAGGLLSQDAWDWYNEHCVDEECPREVRRVAHGQELPRRDDCPREECPEPGERVLMTAEFAKWVQENCPSEECPEMTKSRRVVGELAERREDCPGIPEVTCEDLQNRIDAGYPIPAAYYDWYMETCVDDEFRCEDIQRLIDDGKRLTREQQDFYDRYCIRIEYTCEELLELGLLSEDEYKELCDKEDIPVCVDCDDTPERDRCEDRDDCKVIIPPATGTGAFFDTFNSTGGLGFASILLIAVGGALAGGLLRRNN